jgi:signal transduction histidine kinase/CheY-like chemotaxis protein/HPt (histidine-containing phosphotransfer) domain-containing protein
MSLLRALLPLPSIRNKLVALSFSFLLITVSLVFLLIYTQQRQLLQAQLAESMTAQARLLATNLQAAAAFVDQREADRLLASLAINPAIEAARARLAEGTPLAAYQKNPQAPVTIPEGEASQQFLDDHLLIRQPIVFPGQQRPAGRIELLISLEQYHQTMQRTMSDTGAFLLLALAVLLLLTRLVVSHITAPLEYLAQLVHRVSHHARLDERLNIDSHDEIGSLSHGFNRMLDSLQARDQELASYRESLENMVSERTRALSEAIDEARRANLAKSDFLARMSHEIRTPLNAITGLSRMVLDTPLNPQQREYLEQVMHSSDALLAIINDILDYSKIEAGGLRLENRPFAPERLLHSVSSLFAARARSQELELRFTRDDGVPATLVGDSLRLGQILINLVSNAIKFTAAGSIDVHLAAGERLADGRIRLVCTVRDTGIGIAAEHQDGLFSPFTQADSSITRRFGGTGLGLAICRQLVELMEGEITLDSAPGQGSCFRFTVTLAEPPAGSASATAENANATRSDSALPQWRGERVLVVEDIAINRTIAVALLQRVGLSVAVATNGQEALDLLAGEAFALVLMDIQMPVMDGLTATRAIRANPVWQKLPIIAMTAHATNEDQEQTASAGMNAHLTKPIVPRLLYATLSQWLPPSAAQPPAAITAPPAAAHAPLAELPGIDRQSGLELHLNRPDFYLKSLHAFRQDFAGTGEQVATALAAGDRDEARRLAHSLRSVAASLGAQALADAARELEQALHDGKAESELSSLLGRFGTALEQVIDGLAALPPLTSEPLSAEAAAWPEIEVAIDRLDDCLSHADARSESEFARIRAMLMGQPLTDDKCQSMLNQIAELIDDLEYEPARAKLRLLRHVLGGQLT